MAPKEVLLLCLAVDVDEPKFSRDIQKMAVDAGLPEAHRWPVPSYLFEIDSVTDLVTYRVNGWLLTSTGRDWVVERARDSLKPRKAKVASSLRDHLDKITDPQTRAFVDEAVCCFEYGLHRSAIVLSWVGAVSVLQQHVVASDLSAFNKEATRRNAKWKPVKSTGDFGTMKESVFLDVLESISVIDHGVKTQLKHCLQLRNSCGHPSSLQVGENQVAAHIEMLIQNVFSHFRA